MSETLKHSPESSVDSKELEKAGLEQRERLEESREKAKEKESTAHESIESSRHEIEKAIAEKEAKAHERSAVSVAEKRRDTHKASGSAKKASFKRTMKETQSQMSASSRTFSKLIHNQAVEKVSEAVGGTVASPNALLYGALFAFLFTSAFYFWARHVGYDLSGFESIAAFIIGWLVGIIIDFGRIMVTGKR